MPLVSTVMKKILILLIATLVLTEGHAQLCKTVIGYYPGWQWYDRAGLVNPFSIQYEKYSIINYAFLVPQADGSINISDPWGDKNLLLGQFNWAVSPVGYDTSYDLGNPAYHHTETSLVSKAHAMGTQVAISIGGWTLSDLFPGISADAEKRTRFAHDCCEIIRLYQADGIDLDWEYPGYVEHSGTPNDEMNFSLLVSEIRDSLDHLESEVNRELLLTSAFGASSVHMSNIEWNVMVENLDYINLMTYDFSGTFDTHANHHTALFPSAQGNPELCIDAAVQHLILNYDVPSSMINIGAAYYGKSMMTNGAPALYAPINGMSDLSSFAMDEGSPMYYNILTQSSLFAEHWDDDAKAPYLTGNNGLESFVTYDNENSIAEKGQYVLDENLAGVIIWEITGDYIETFPSSGIVASTPLTDALNDALCGIPSIELDCENMCVTDIAMNAEGGLLDITIQNGNVQINYPIVMVVWNGDTIANINQEFFFFAQLPGQTVIHTVPTTWTDIPVDLNCQVIITDASFDENCMLDYPCLVDHVFPIEDADMGIYPNPTSDLLSFHSKESFIFVEISDVNGKVYLSQNYLSADGQIDIRGLSAGIYMLKTKQVNGEPKTLRFVVER